MRFGVEDKYKDIYKIFQVLNSHVNEEINLNDMLMQIVSNGVTSSDLFFLVLQKLGRDGYVNGKDNIVNVFRTIEDGTIRIVTDEINNEIRRKRRLFVTPLEVGKFYQCPRRLWLEKMVLSRQFKEQSGKVWDGELIHFAVNCLVENMGENVDSSIEEIVKITFDKYRDKIGLNEEKVRDFLLKLCELINEEKLSKIFTEKTFESFKMGLIGTPDIVAIKESGDIIPIDIKLGRLSQKGVKEEHLLQNVGEGILVENFFRKKTNYSYLIYFESNSLVRVDIDEGLKREFINCKRDIERLCRGRYVPETSGLSNSRIRVCKGCHVRPACNNIETLKRVSY